MNGFLGQDYKNSLKTNFDEAIKGGKIIVSFLMEGKRVPGKMYCRSPWVVELNDTEIKIVNDMTKKVSKKVSVSDIEEVAVKVVKGFNNAPGKFMTQSISCEMQVNINEKEYCFICEDLHVVPILFKWLKRNNLNYKDLYDLEKLYNEMDEKEVVEILYSKISEISER